VIAELLAKRVLHTRYALELSDSLLPAAFLELRHPLENPETV
jgi:hypothetical protein